eukprot:TRINITY_DN17483_c0_g1_i1.p1 TRINITY_DN17483_c0_g1~~TRINITY_DN17483_c0_g1_i1.p1  ORF type:complete len:222 (+),score=54.31 TRINITY_DN17483_c0_g1_i1:299-964(+)
MVCIQDSTGVGYEWCRQLLARGDNVVAAVQDPATDEELRALVFEHRENGSGDFKYNTIDPVPIPGSQEVPPAPDGTACDPGQDLPELEYLIVTADSMPDAPYSTAGTVDVMVEQPMSVVKAVEPNLLRGHGVNGRRVVVYANDSALANKPATDIVNYRLAATVQQLAWQCHALEVPELTFVLLQPSLETEGGKLSVHQSVGASLAMLDRANQEHSGTVVSL